jgi:hypothetical protein
MGRLIARRVYLASLIAAMGAVAALGGCAASARDRHFQARSLVHQPVRADQHLPSSAPTRPIATVPTGLD